MAQKHINTDIPNSGNGDALRDAFIKTEDNFNELYATKVDKVSGKGLTTNDFTTAEKEKLAGIPADAEKNVQGDFLVNDPSSDAYIKNKPEFMTSVNWGQIEGDIANQSDLQNALAGFPTYDYVDGKISQTINPNIFDFAPSEDAIFNALTLKEDIADKNNANGYAGLDASGKLFSNQLPALAISETFVVASQAEMLGLTGAETGDIAVRTDINKTFILKQSPSSELASWQELLTPTDAVTSVFGRTGAVVANAGDYTTALVTETTNKRYQTDVQAARNDATSSIQTQLDSKAFDSTVLHKTGNEIFEGVKSATNTGNGMNNGISLTNNSSFAPVLQVVNAGNGTGANILNTLGIGLQIQNEANNGYGLTIGHNSNGRAINISSTKNGQGIYVANISGGTGAQIDNFSDGLGLHINNNNDVDATGLKITNNGINKGLEILNNKAGHGISLENRESGSGIYITNGTGTGLGTGISLQNNGNRNGIGISNTGSGLGIYNINSSNGVGARFDNNSTGVGVQIRANGSGTGNLFEAIKENVVVTQIDTNGNIWTRTPDDGENSTRVATTAFVRNNSVNGIGTGNYIPKFTGAGTLGNSRVLDDSNIVSITKNSNTTTPLSNTILQLVSNGNNADVNLQFSDATAYSTIIGQGGQGALYFVTNGIERARILNNGNVGIGTNNPLAKLHIQSPTLHSYPTLGAMSGSFFLGGDDNKYGLIGGIHSADGNTWLQAQRVDGLTTPYNLILQPAGGNVGIGTSNPNSKLDVRGNTNIITDATQLLLATQTNTNKQLLVEYSLIRNCGVIQAIEQTVNYRNLALNPDGGNILIGTTADTGQKLQINGIAKARSFEYESGINIGATNLNSLNKGGFFIGSEMVNAPNEYWWYITSEIHDGGGYRKQTATSYGGGANPIAGGTSYIRVYTDGANWSTWQQVLTGGGDLPTSGTFTPSATSDFTARLCYYVQVGKIVTVTYNGVFNLASSIGGSSFTLSLPAGKNNKDTTTGQIIGHGTIGIYSVPRTNLGVKNNGVSTCSVEMGSTPAGAHQMNFTITYETN